MILSNNKRLAGLLLLIPTILLVPAIAMLFSTEVNWTAIDFVTMGGLLLGVVLACEWILRRFPQRKHRFALLAVVAILFLLTWAEMAVGIFGSPIAGN